MLAIIQIVKNKIKMHIKLFSNLYLISTLSEYLQKELYRKNYYQLVKNYSTQEIKNSSKK